jgi:hypothetical protein
MTASDHLDELLARKARLESSACRESGFDTRLQALRTWQAARLTGTYQDFRDDPQYAPAVEFFLSDLYGPHATVHRDRDLRRAWRYLKRALPGAAMKVLGQAIELDVLSLELDHAMVHALGDTQITDAGYAAAYRSVDHRASRARQIELIVGIGESLDRVVRRPWVGPLLLAAHVPAHAAGCGILQDFLERGYAAFRRMQNAALFLNAIHDRETRFMNTLFRVRDQRTTRAREPAHE